MSRHNTEQTDTHIGTAEIEHDLTDWLTLRDQLRYQRDLRYSIVTPPRSACRSAPAI